MAAYVSYRYLQEFFLVSSRSYKSRSSQLSYLSRFKHLSLFPLPKIMAPKKEKAEKVSANAQEDMVLNYLIQQK
jgi:hypothetical protein